MKLRQYKINLFGYMFKRFHWCIVWPPVTLLHLFRFLDLLENKKSKIILNQVLSYLHKHNFSHEFLIKNRICFAYGWASNIICRNASVGKRINILICLYGDVLIIESSSINYFKIFFDYLYDFYIASPKYQHGILKHVQKN